MKYRLTRFAAVVATLTVLAGCVSPGKSGWVPLFDGTSTAHWRGFRKNAFPEKGWEIQDNTLHFIAGSGGGDIVTREEYASFDLRFEWKVSPGANSGVIYRVSEAFEAPWHTGPEYQVLDDSKHPDGRNPKTSAAAAYALLARNPATKPNPVGEWNQGRIVVQGDHVEHWLNGQKAVSYDFNQPAFAALVQNSKFKNMPRFGRESTGHICLQDHGDAVWYRNIRIRPL